MMSRLLGFSVPPPSSILSYWESGMVHEQAEDGADNLTGRGSILYKIIYDGNYGHQIFIPSFTHAIWLGKMCFSQASQAGRRKGSELLGCLGQHSANFEVGKKGNS